jgi:hypothetical protein
MAIQKTSVTNRILWIVPLTILFYLFLAHRSGRLGELMMSKEQQSAEDAAAE